MRDRDGFQVVKLDGVVVGSVQRGLGHLGSPTFVPMDADGNRIGMGDFLLFELAEREVLKHARMHGPDLTRGSKPESAPVEEERGSGSHSDPASGSIPPQDTIAHMSGPRPTVKPSRADREAGEGLSRTGFAAIGARVDRTADLVEHWNVMQAIADRQALYAEVIRLRALLAKPRRSMRAVSQVPVTDRERMAAGIDAVSKVFHTGGIIDRKDAPRVVRADTAIPAVTIERLRKDGTGLSLPREEDHEEGFAVDPDSGHGAGDGFPGSDFEPPS